MRSRTFLVGALAATAALLTGCSTGPGPLVAESFSGFDCIPGALYPTLTVGDWILRDTGTSPVTVTSVKLAPSSRGLAMTRAWLAPLYKPPHGSWSYLGDGEPYPPIHWRTWPERQPIPGAIIKPGGQGLNLFFGLTWTGPKDGHTAGPVITYTADGHSYTVQGQFGIVVIAPHTHCPRAV